VQTRIKWPNDLLVAGKKVCGILIEQSGTPGTATTVVGIGLNLTQTAEEFAEANLPAATSLGLLSSKRIDTHTAAEAVIRKLDDEYARLVAGERVTLEADWKWRVGLLGRHVEIELLGGGTATGRLREMSFDGLELENGDGFVTVIAPESAAHIRPQP
jgi:BirA family biotin operon repressor/biotin-[acetyl-CoA-carboxylase] ligase